MELIEAAPQIIECVKALRWLIAAPFVVIGALCAWGWWNNVTV
jgi:hypothetical protein